MATKAEAEAVKKQLLPLAKQHNASIATKMVDGGYAVVVWHQQELSPDAFPSEYNGVSVVMEFTGIAEAY